MGTRSHQTWRTHRSFLVTGRIDGSLGIEFHGCAGVSFRALLVTIKRYQTKVILIGGEPNEGFTARVRTYIRYLYSGLF